ncbi:hypothetical protein AUR64_15375 [Haloprofundus marisrubri]|uniref:Uncharacterized protein n=1 Tax=Haloprofundus marisrubri TaxID=1514971 RepID=A0A0W1R8L2_9EURY|nr:hypothetical protein [Haloprofundus marisrubri]KTG09173.1 hypothetical protein AUR64_15375 [Haloprofundus marisrubri]
MGDDRAEPNDESAWESTTPVESNGEMDEKSGETPDTLGAEVFADLPTDQSSGADDAAVESALDALATRLDGLDERVDGVQSDVDEKIDDVRGRVVQIKRETDGKAPLDHEHPEVRQAVAEASADVEALERRVESVSSDLDEELNEQSAAYEELAARVETAEERLATLARVTVDLRDRVQNAEATVAARGELDEFLESAHRNGVSKGVCADCGETVHLGLLSSPTCPHCGASFAGVTPASWPFGSATLTTEAGAEDESKEKADPNATDMTNFDV